LKATIISRPSRSYSLRPPLRVARTGSDAAMPIARVRFFRSPAVTPLTGPSLRPKPAANSCERRGAAENVAIARVELLYPFAKEQLSELIASYPNLKELVWTQEEPRNMGPWKVMSRRLPDLLPEGVELGYVGRPTRASPGEGYSVAHAREQERIVLTALTAGA